MRRAGKCWAVWNGHAVPLRRRSIPAARNARGPQHRNTGNLVTYVWVLILSAVVVGLAAAPGWGLANASLEPEVGGPADCHVSSWDAGGERGARPFAGDIELADGLWTKPAYGYDDADDDEPSHDYDALAEYTSGRVISLMGGNEGKDLDRADRAERKAGSVFQRCYGGQGTRADPRQAG